LPDFLVIYITSRQKYVTRKSARHSHTNQKEAKQIVHPLRPACLSDAFNLPMVFTVNQK